MVVLGRYDPGMIIERHAHSSDHLIYVLEGELACGEYRARVAPSSCSKKARSSAR
jgi:uncharacterized cupin superfamily protein